MGLSALLLLLFLPRMKNLESNPFAGLPIVPVDEHGWVARVRDRGVELHQRMLRHFGWMFAMMLFAFLPGLLGMFKVGLIIAATGMAFGMGAGLVTSLQLRTVRAPTAG